MLSSYSGRILAAAILVLFSLLYKSGFLPGPSTESMAKNIGRDVTSFQELSERFQKLAQWKGALYAYDVLRVAKLPGGTDLHLLAHVVGDELYKEKGTAGIKYCTNEFRNACSHTIVIGTLNERGDAGLKEIRDACKQAPGGSGAYTMCFHGLGHGVFAAEGYDLDKTATFCGKTGTKEYNNREYEECFGGAIMELMGGGGHDKKLWTKRRTEYLSVYDPLAPCSTGLVPPALKGICYTYLSPHLFEFAGADLAHPLPNHFAGAFKYCDLLPAGEPRLRNACFGGIGKEFPVLALGRDIRAIGDASPKVLETIWGWCSLAPNQEGVDACAEQVLNSLFWGGENNPEISASFCSVSPNKNSEERCFDQVEGLIGYYLKSATDIKKACKVLPSARFEHCAAPTLQK